MNTYIYEITNEITRESYIGIRQCNCPVKDDKYKGENTIISRDFRRYGKKNFKKRFLCIVVDDSLKNKLLDIYTTNPDFVNHIFLEEYEDGDIPPVKRITTGAKNGASRKVICLNTKEVFDTIVEASMKYNISPSGITHVCNPDNLKQFAGKDTEGNPLRWMYYDAYTAEQNGEEFDYKKNKYKNKTVKTKPVICVTTGEVFSSIKEASKKYNIHSGTISASCMISTHHAGKHPETGESLKWEYINK